MKVWAVFFLLFFTLPCLAEIPSIEDLALGSHGLKASEKSSGKALWRSEVKSRKTANEKGEPFLLIEEDGAGAYGKEGKYQIWHSAAYFQITGTKLMPYQVKQIYKDPSGRITRTAEKYYDQGKKEVRCNINGSLKNIEFKSDLVDKELLGTVLINYPLDRPSMVFHLLTHEPTLYKITMKYLGNETVNVGSKQFECYKLQMIPDLGALNILGAFVPKTYFWYTLSEPRRFVRYEGLESGLGTPYIVLEADS
jgi:hypothetical protein